MRQLQLLKHRVRGTGGELVGGEQQGGQTVGGGQGGTGGHVRRAGAYGRRHTVGLPAAGMPGVADRLMHQSLLIATLVVGHEAGRLDLRLLERLTDSGKIAVPEDAVHPRNGANLDAFAVDDVHGPLVGEELHSRLRDGEGAGARAHRVSWVV